MPGLKGKIIISLASEEKSDKITRIFSEKGAFVYNYPMIKTEPASGNDKAVSKILSKITDFKLIIFTSVNAVKYFFYKLEKLNISADLINAEFAVIGNATEKMLNRYGFKSNYNFRNRNSSEFAYDLLKVTKTPKKNILIPSGNLSPDNLGNILSEYHKIEKITVYDTIITDKLDASLQELILKNNYDFMIFLSPSAVYGLMNNLPGQVNKKNMRCAVIGSVTKKAINKYDIKPFFIPSVPDIEVMAEELEHFFEENKFKHILKY
ncbi:MAG: uroporphyrinogen-III synthase [Chlorobi bacterium]|nr:uroporphyrinogen-III synthase [Chlorobiota bacterium]